MTIKIRIVYSSIIFSTIVFLLGCLLFSTLLKSYFLPVFYFLVFYFMLVTFAGQMLVLKSDPRKIKSFNTRYFLARWIKVFIHLLFIVIYTLNDRENVLTFILGFMTCYVIYSVFDIYILNFYLKKVT